MSSETVQPVIHVGRAKPGESRANQRGDGGSASAAAAVCLLAPPPADKTGACCHLKEMTGWPLRGQICAAATQLQVLGPV